MIATYIRWVDASYSQGDIHHDDLALISLDEIGWLVKETQDAVTLSMERPEPGQEDYRLTLTIPKACIIERKTIKVHAKGKTSRSATTASGKESPVEMPQRS